MGWNEMRDICWIVFVIVAFKENEFICIIIYEHLILANISCWADVLLIYDGINCLVNVFSIKIYSVEIIINAAIK